MLSGEELGVWIEEQQTENKKTRVGAVSILMAH